MSQNIRVYKKRLQISQKKWNTVQGQSLRTVNTILNTISRLSLITRPNIFSKSLMDRFEDIPERLAFNLTEMINNSINDLKSYIEQFENCLKEMRKIEQQFRIDFSLITKKQVMEETNREFHDLEVIEQVERTIQEIVDMYETELTLRKQVLAEIQESISLKPLMITAYLVLWASEIYIENTRIHELLEEFSYAEKVYQTQRQSQDPYNYVDLRKKP